MVSRMSSRMARCISFDKCDDCVKSDLMQFERMGRAPLPCTFYSVGREFHSRCRLPVVRVA